MRDDSAPARTSGAAPESSLALRDLLRERSLWLLSAATFGLAALPLLLGRSYFFRDLYLWTFPQRQRLVDLVLSGGLPLWDPFLHGGQPFLGNVNNLALYPTAVLSFVLPVVTAVNLEIALHFALVAAATYLLARTLGLSEAGALFAATALTASGVVLALGNLFNRLVALPHLVLLLLFWRLYLREGKRRWFVAAAIAGALQLLAGSPEFFLLSFLLALVWGLVDPPSENAASRPRRAAAAAILGLSAAGLAAVQLLPMAEILASSQRGRGFSASESAIWSLSPRRLPELAVPGWFGRVDTLDPADYWGSRVEDEGFPYLLSVSFGLTLLSLAAAAVASRSADGPLSRPTRRLLTGVAVLGLILSLGRFLPFAWLQSVWTFGGLFRYPVKFLVPTALAVALLAAHGAESALRRGGTARSVALALGAAALLLAGTGVILASGVPAGGALQRFLFLEASERGRTGLALALFRAAVFAVLAAAVLLRRRGEGIPRGLHLLTAIVAAELLWAGRQVQPTVARDFFTKEPPAASAVRAALGQGRLFRAEDPPGRTQRAPSNDIQWLAWWNRETLAFHTGAAFGLPVVFHDDFDGLAPARMADLTRFVRSLPWTERASVLSAAAASVMVAGEALNLEGWRLLGRIENASDREYFVYANDRSAARAGLVHYWRYVPSADQARAAIASPSFDPRKHVALEGAGPPPTGGPPPASSLAVLSARPTRAILRAETSAPAYLVFSEPFTPGWHVTVDGRESPILPANGAFGAVYLPAGTHVVERRYRPAVGWGALISLGTLIALVVAPRRRFARGRRA